MRYTIHIYSKKKSQLLLADFQMLITYSHWPDGFWHENMLIW